MFKNLEDHSYVPSWDSYQFYDEIDSGSACHCFNRRYLKKEGCPNSFGVFFWWCSG